MLFFGPSILWSTSPEFDSLVCYITLCLYSEAAVMLARQGLSILDRPKGDLEGSATSMQEVYQITAIPLISIHGLPNLLFISIFLSVVFVST